MKNECFFYSLSWFLLYFFFGLENLTATEKPENQRENDLRKRQKTENPVAGAFLFSIFWKTSFLLKSIYRMNLKRKGLMNFIIIKERWIDWNLEVPIMRQEAEGK